MKVKRDVFGKFMQKANVKLKMFILIIALVMFIAQNFSWAQEETKGKTVSINGMDMYYETYGQGEPLVLLHGFFQTCQSWNPMISDFSKDFLLIIPDLRGHGHSTNPSNEFTHRQSALDVFSLLEHLDIDQFKAMGISTGGMTLLHMATQQPDRIKNMVLIGATTYFPEQARAIMDKYTIESRSERNWDSMRKKHKIGDDQIKALWTQFRNFKDNYDDMNFTSTDLSTIVANTLIVHGDRDSFFPVSIPIQMYTGIPNAYLWIVPKGGHLPIYGKRLPYFTETAKAFLRDKWTAKAK